MKSLSKIQNLIFRLGAILMTVGAGMWIVGGWIPIIMYSAGVFMFVAMQVEAQYDGNDITVVRLRRQQMLGCAALLLAAFAMVAQQMNVSLPVRNAWLPCLLVGAILQLYTAIRIPQALKTVAVAFIAAASFASCSNQYIVDGSTTVHGMEGKMMYLKVYDNKKLRSLDSCFVTHGKFMFRGKSDSTIMANLFMGNQSLMPVVLEGSDIVLKIDDVSQVAAGSPLNDSLYSFIQKKTQLDNQLAELPRMEGRMVMDGMEHDEVMARLSAQARQLSIMSDQLVTSFIKSNYSNVLGPGVFMIMTSEYAYPVLTPQIEEIIIGAPESFLSNPYVKEYMRVARDNMDKLHQQ